MLQTRHVTVREGILLKWKKQNTIENQIWRQIGKLDQHSTAGFTDHRLEFIQEENKLTNNHTNRTSCCLNSLTLLRSSNTGNIFAQLVAKHCCIASWKALLSVLPPSLSTCHATNFDVASCGNMLRKVDLSSTFCNKLSILLFGSQLATLHNTCDWSIFPHQKRGKDGE